LLQWRISDAWKAIDPALSFRRVADQVIDAGAGWVQWNRMEKLPAMPEDSWWQPDFIGDLVHWEKQLRGSVDRSEQCSHAGPRRSLELGCWEVFGLEATKLTAHVSDLVGTMQGHLDFPELDLQIDPEGWIGQQLSDCEASWAVLALDTSRSPHEVGGLVLWHPDSKMGWEMRWLGVKPRCRGKGLASHLVQKSLELLDQQQPVSPDLPCRPQSGCADWEARSLWVSCDGRNRPMIGLLEKLKFFPVYQSSLLFWWRASSTFRP
jgi:ribosomal protein S18 acetylase RimI-like enzyme